MNLDVEVTFTTNHFHGEEWPPAPARLFQALIAATYGGANKLINGQARDEALGWLETLSPPLILALPRSQSDRSREQLINYVPNNDDNTLKRSGHIRAAKSMTTYPLPKGGETIVYRWPLAQQRKPALSHAETILAMASLVTYLGRTIDLVYARGFLRPESPPLHAQAEGRCWHHPTISDGGRWLSPAHGFLAFCQRRYPRSVSQEPPDFTNSQQVEYVLESSTKVSADIRNHTVPVALFELRPINATTREFYDFPPTDLREPIGMVRHALSKLKPKLVAAHGATFVANQVFGHAASDAHSPASAPHLAIVAIPSLSLTGTADGRIRRVGLFCLAKVTPEIQSLFDDVVHALHASVLEDRGRAVAELRRCSNTVEEKWLLPYLQPGTLWRTHTPVILPGYPRRGRPPEQLVQRALQQAGFTQENIHSISAHTGPLIPKTQTARAYRINEDGYLGRTPRYHVEIIFKKSIPGPLILGRGRHFGLGLFVPVSAARSR